MAELEDDESAAGLVLDTTLDAAGDPVIALSGELDIAGAETLKEAVAAAVVRRPARLTFDLGNLRFMDSAGIAVLVGAKREIDTVKLRNPSPIVMRVLELTGMIDVFPIET